MPTCLPLSSTTPTCLYARYTMPEMSPKVDLGPPKTIATATASTLVTTLAGLAPVAFPGPPKVTICTNH
jgi:hypothetical protein